MNRRSISRRMLGLIALFALMSAGAEAQVQSATGSLLDDATIYRDQQDANGGGYTGVCVGNVGSSSNTRRGLIRYELPAIPAGATITRVTLSVTQDRVRFQGANAPKTATLRLKRAVEAWTEGSLTGNNAACGGGTNGAGVTWNTRPETAEADTGSTSLSTSNGQVVTFDTDVGIENDGLLADVQAWVDGAANQGWEVSVDEENESDNARLIRPGTLTVYWTGGQQETFTINPGLNDVWWQSDINGQGFSISVFPETAGGFVFVTWYAFEVERPTEDVAATAILGEAGHRWLTAFGTFSGDTATLTIENTVGGVFHSPTPPVSQDQSYGTMTIQFQGCNNATMTYDIPSLTLMGTMELTRIATDNVVLCEAFLQPNP